MIRLAIAVGFLSVFGLVAYSTILLLKNYFRQKEEKQNVKKTTKTKKND
jgi:hypothetical protein